MTAVLHCTVLYCTAVLHGISSVGIKHIYIAESLKHCGQAGSQTEGTTRPHLYVDILDIIYSTHLGNYPMLRHGIVVSIFIAASFCWAIAKAQWWDFRHSRRQTFFDSIPSLTPSQSTHFFSFSQQSHAFNILRIYYSLTILWYDINHKSTFLISISKF